MLKSKKNLFFLIFLFLLGIFSRIPFLEKMQSHWDGPDYTIAILQYSFKNFTPSPPGYPIYIGIGKFFYTFVRDPHLAILLVSVLFAGLGTVIFYIAGKSFFNKSVGVISAVLFLTAPTTYYFGITSNPYGILPTTAVFLATVVFLVFTKKRNFGLLLGFAASFAVGVRPQDALFLTPLIIFGAFKLERKEKIIFVLSTVSLTLLWLVPQVIAVGGISEYVHAVLPFFQNNATPNISVERILSIWEILLKGFYLTLGFAGVFLLYFIKPSFPYFLKRKHLLSKQKILSIIFALWIIPSLFFNVFVRSDHAAHQMTYLSACIILSSYAIWRLFGKYKLMLTLLIIALVVLNLFTFFRDRDPKNIKPYVSQSYHYSEIIKNNDRLASIVFFVEKTYFPKSTMIIVDPEIFRPVTYYLKQYPVYAFSSLDTASQNVVNSVHYGLDWEYVMSQDTKHIFTVPNNINQIVCITNNKPFNFNFKNVKKIILAKNGYVYSFAANSGQKYRFSLHSIQELH